jgi:phosphoesterase RecJ-like protein
MFLEIYKLIEKYENIVIARHIGVDPDAMASSFALKNSILLTFPDKHVRLAGTGSNRFSYFGKLDKNEEVKENTLLIVTDTPDIRRIDGIDDLSKFSAIIKIDHHPFIEKFGENSLEYIDVNSGSASQIVLELINNTDLLMDKQIAEQIFWGIVSDTNRFMYNDSSSKTFYLVGDLIDKFGLDLVKLYEPLYSRPLEEVRLEGYIAMNLEVTENGVAYIKINNATLEEYKTDAASPGNMIGNFNYIDGINVWVFITEDVKNENFRISIRSRGPVINNIAEKYNGGGHKFASGAKITNINLEDNIKTDLDEICLKYQNKKREEDEKS